MSHDPLRRAAVLIASLDTDSADALLEEMSSEQAALVRNAVMELGEIGSVEQQAVISQFVESNPQAASMLDTGVEVDAELAAKFGAHSEESMPVDDAPPEPAPTSTRPFAFLDAVDSEDLARVLSSEHPQTTAIVTAHLEPQRAAEVIAFLPRTQQTETLTRIARLTTPHADIIRDLELEMQQLLANQHRRELVGPAGLATVEAILQSASPTTRQDLVADLSQHDQMLARQLQSAAGYTRQTAAQRSVSGAAAGADANGAEHQSWESGPHANTHGAGDHGAGEHGVSPRLEMEFAELEQLDNDALAQILHRSGSNTTLLALAGASHPFVKRILTQLPQREANQLERRIQNIGPLRLDDVQRAQEQLVSIALQLMEEGVLAMPGKSRLSVAA